MFIAELCESGPDQGKWYMMAREARSAIRRAGYCATRCAGHETREQALEHYLQYQLDREAVMNLTRPEERACEICAEPTTQRARLGRQGHLFALCRRHQTTGSLQTAYRRRSALEMLKHA